MATVRFFDDDGMDFAVRCVLSGVRYGLAEVGEVFSTCEAVEDGDPDSWYDAWVDRGRWAREIGDECAIDGHHRSAWGAYLRAANYLYCGNYYAPATTDPGRFRPTWAEHRAAWDRAIEVWPGPAEAVSVPFEDTALPGYWFEPAASASAAVNGPSGAGSTGMASAAVDGPSGAGSTGMASVAVDGPSGAGSTGMASVAVNGPSGAGSTVLLVGGIDAPISDALMTGLVDGLDRGHRVLCLEGPGQGQAFFGQGLALRPDWETVIDAALLWLVERPGVDPRRVALAGVNHGSLFVARAASHLGDRIAALVLDPGVTVLTPGDVAPVNDEQRPADEDLAAYALDDDDLRRITAPVYVADPDAAMGYVGQAAAMAAALRGFEHPVVHDRFTTAEGAGLDCEIQAPQVRNQRVYDWLDRRLGR